MKFLDINVVMPGGEHDACVFALSTVFDLGLTGRLSPDWTETFEGVDVPLMILGDSAYPSFSWLMKPFPEGRGLTAHQSDFNHCLSSERIVVERLFGRLRGKT